MPRYRVTVAYDGTNFAGFQRQPQQRTVQGTLEQALTKMTKGQFVKVQGSGRTDAGVHAHGQVINFDYPKELPPRNMRLALNSLLPLDMEVVASQLAAPDFHAQFDTIGKCYRYQVSRGRFTDPFRRFYTGHYPYPLDVALIQQALPDLLGEHDFTSFAASGGVIKNKVRTIYRATVVENPADHELTFEFIGNGFLYNMVRILVATALEIGNGRRAPDDFQRLLRIGDRQAARGTAPASGLYLEKVFYPGDEAELTSLSQIEIVKPLVPKRFSPEWRQEPDQENKI